MALFEWQDKFSVKINSIDEQHKKLINIINDLHDAMLEGKSREIIKEVLFRLVDYTKTHFTYEEELFEKHGYSEKVSHEKQHDEFVQKLYEVVEKFKVIKSFVSIEIMEFLKDWLVNHIMGIDKKYSDFLISKGVS